MTTVLLALHLLIAIVMIGLILLQKTEGNASGAGFSGSASVESMMRPRARPNPLGRATSILGICFFATSLGLALMARPKDHQATSIMNEAPASGPVVPKIDDTPPADAAPAAPATPAAPEVPSAPAAPAVPSN